METITNLLLIVGMLIVIFIGAFAGKMQAVTLWAGKKIAPEGLEAELPTGLQDAITPKIQNTFNTLLPISYIGIIILGGFIKWYMGIVLLILALIVMVIVKNFFPSKTNFYLKLIMHYMAHRQADFAKENDVMRADAAGDMYHKLENLYLETKDLDLRVPEFAEIKNMKLGR